MSEIDSVRNQAADLSLPLFVLLQLSHPNPNTYTRKQKKIRRDTVQTVRENGICRRQRERLGTKLFHFLLCILPDYFMFFLENVYFEVEERKMFIKGKENRIEM